jgi:SNF2 family DNA or RNA helicase
MTCATCHTTRNVTQWPCGLRCWRCALMAHQRQGLEIGQRKRRWAFFWEPGAGKTILILAIIADAAERGYSGKTVVLAPKSILHSAWLRDAAHFPGLRAQVIWHTSPAKRRKMIQESTADVLVTNYETFKKHADDLLDMGVTRLVVDESAKVKEIRSQISGAAFNFSLRMDSVYLLTGTPAPNVGTEYYGQIRCVDRALFGDSFWRFAFNYFLPIKRTIHDKERIIGWKPIESKQAEFLEKLASVSWTLRKRDCLDLPPQIDVIREVTLGAEERRAYDEMMDELRVELAGGEVIDARTNGRMMKLRQLAGGMILDGGRARIVGRSKLDELGELLDELAGRPAVIWAQFTADIDRIAAEIRGRGASVEIIDGRCADPLARGEITRRFQGGELQYLVCHSAAIGHGATFTRAAEEIFYNYDYDPGLHEQARDRNHRIGQNAECVTYFYLCAKGTIDERMFWVLKNKKRASDATKEMLYWLREAAGVEAKRQEGVTA